MSGEKILVHIERGLEELIPMFFEESENEIQELRAAVASGDLTTIKLLGHRIKGSSLSYGFEGMSIIGKEIEDAVIQNKSQAELLKLVDQLVHYVRHVEIIYDE